METGSQLSGLSEEELDQIFALHAAFCTVFSDRKRLKIMWYLRSGERRVNEIVDHLGVPIQNVSQHLRIMKDKGAVTSRREGHAVYYRVANTKFIQGCDLIREGLLEELGRYGRLSRS